MHVEKNYVDLENMLDDALSIDCDFGVTFVTKFENASFILKEILSFSEFMPFLIEFEDPSFDGYDKEFFISVNNNGEVFCEKFYHKDKCFMPGDGVIFVLPDCSDECISHLYKYNDCFYIEVGFEDDELDENNCDCIIHADDFFESNLKKDPSFSALLKIISTLE